MRYQVRNITKSTIASYIRLIFRSVLKVILHRLRINHHSRKSNRLNHLKHN